MGKIRSVETLDVGADAGTPVTDEYPTRGNAFRGKINWVQIDLGLDEHMPMIDADHVVHVRPTKQWCFLPLKVAGIFDVY